MTAAINAGSSACSELANAHAVSLRPRSCPVGTGPIRGFCRPLTFGLISNLYLALHLEGRFELVCRAAVMFITLSI